ncbi:hypothetical protein PSA7680_03572 [Pseudoruegeria aquimaris]|uniref:Uncharacterized protein n=1 Tax=Pseudoruegeria aquimaris TaxID=393663 RepID=A0A1Y5TTE8_9RHOB|nr:hypothetical protein PSA7680_03572 [Pseudoruegeria aquimaris]
MGGVQQRPVVPYPVGAEAAFAGGGREQVARGAKLGHRRGTDPVGKAGGRIRHVVGGFDLQALAEAPSLQAAAFAQAGEEIGLAPHVHGREAGEGAGYGRGEPQGDLTIDLPVIRKGIDAHQAAGDRARQEIARVADGDVRQAHGGRKAVLHRRAAGLIQQNRCGKGADVEDKNTVSRRGIETFLAIYVHQQKIVDGRGVGLPRTERICVDEPHAS